ncbi:hypothetical protein [Wielerella bovis]|uniref:hypothetical protein n=1 Tax=Wielerella bovis TaxID=2917790 RepID=UPI002019BB6E|nr:hypothetical protein [Wielerella bovis]ULJ66198.1 hypothetical protein MIS31_07930 [Wielerella bovis]
MKKLLLIITLTGIYSTALAEMKLPSSSYGKWQNQETSYTISKRGISSLNMSRCQPVYKTERISGAKLLADIQQSIEYTSGGEVSNDYVKDMMKAANLISKNKIYSRVTGWYEKCGADGAVGFVPLTDKVGLDIQSGPDDVYNIIYKK